MQELSAKTNNSERIIRLKRTVQEYERGICTERALLWTEYFRNKVNRKKPVIIQMAEALRHVLMNKSIILYPDELIIGNYTSKRVGGIIYPESHGLVVLLDLLKFPRRRVNPLRISRKEQLKLAMIMPFWQNRFIVAKAFPNPITRILYSWKQLQAKDYFINEVGGIAHLTPDHAKLIALGTDKIKEEIEKFRTQNTDQDKDSFYQAALIAVEALALFGERYADYAQTLAEKEQDSTRRAELLDIVTVCRNVPRNGSRTFREALQSLFFLHIAIFQESMGETVCPGRIDQLLYPYYQRDLAAGRITSRQARELLAAFSIKLCETIPVFSQALTRVFEGMPSWQVVTIGGMDRNGNDATNELSYMLIDIANELRMRQPNFHARFHAGTPDEFKKLIYGVLAEGSNTPSLFNDDVIIPTMTGVGYDIHDTRDYVAIGCVEPTVPGKTLGSTDAAMVNVPLAIELALNEGRCFDSLLRSGAPTMSIKQMKNMDDVTAAFVTQLNHMVSRLIKDLQCIELAHARYRPIPLTSTFIDGCLVSGACATQGAAHYNFSGIQGVGIATAGDSLCAIEKLVFQERKISLLRLCDVLAARDADPYWFSLMKRAPKFGNNDERTDFWTEFVVNQYAKAMQNAGKNTRGGQYIAGIYSNTAHIHFGRNTGALPCGRPRGGEFPSGMAPQNGMDKSGPTALINSMNKIDYKQIANGINFNLKLDTNTLRDEQGRNLMKSLLDVYFKRGGMQVQLNVLDAAVLREAKEHPDKYPFLMVRVSGYSAYFNDLSPEMKDEIIARTSNKVC